MPDSSRLTFDEEHAYCSDPGKISDVAEVVVAYIAGFVVRHLRATLKCHECTAALRTPSCGNRAYSLIRRKSHGGLIFPSKDVLTICQNTEKQLWRALAYSTLASRMLAAKISAATMATLIGKDLFRNLNEHMIDNAPLESHSQHLVRAIVDKYLDIRMHHAAKTTTQRLHQEKVRQKHTKLTQFKGQ